MPAGDLDKNIETLRQCKIISEGEVGELCKMAKAILMEEENVHHGAPHARSVLARTT